MPPYQRLLGDAMRGDGELFGREDIVDAQWRIVEPILETMRRRSIRMRPEAGAGRGRGADGQRRPWRNPRLVLDAAR